MTTTTIRAIRVAIVDDHPLVRTGLRTVIDATPDLRVVGEAADGDEAVTVVEETAPDVVLMDLSMERMDGVTATRLVTRAHAVTVVVLTSYADRERVVAAVDAGAVGYLLKDSEPEAIRRAVRDAAAGHSPLDPRVAGSLLAARRGDPAEPQASDPVADLLSPRERDVLVLVMKGRANKQIARELGITERTVKAHLGHVFRALGVADRTSAALWARDHGLDR